MAPEKLGQIPPTGNAARRFALIVLSLGDFLAAPERHDPDELSGAR
jgi:hypothetical protein